MVDGIFVVTMTILVLGMNPPKPECSQAQAVLPGQIFHLFPEIFIFIIAFLILAGFWLDHHRQFHFVSTIDSRLLWINIFLLISVVLIPISTDVAGDYPQVQVAVLLFHMNILIVGLIFSYHLHHISQSEYLLESRADMKSLKRPFHQSLLIPNIALLAAVISFVNPSVSLLVYLIIPFAKYFVVVNESGRMSTRRSPIIRYFTARLTINYFYQHNAVCIRGGDKKTNDYRKCIRSWRHV
jgi:TMEM175 potassium channel family protein